LWQCIEKWQPLMRALSEKNSEKMRGVSKHWTIGDGEKTRPPLLMMDILDCMIGSSL